MTRLCIDSPKVSGLHGRGVPVAVIDSGVNPDHPHVGAVAGGVRIQLSGDVSGDYVDRMGHGTAVFAAIQEKAPGAELFAVRVFSDRLRTSARALVAAIDWAAERRVRVVNLSLGTLREDHAEMLEAAVGPVGGCGGRGRGGGGRRRAALVAGLAAQGGGGGDGRGLPARVRGGAEGGRGRARGGGRRAVSEADPGGPGGAKSERDQLCGGECDGNAGESAGGGRRAGGARAVPGGAEAGGVKEERQANLAILYSI